MAWSLTWDKNIQRLLLLKLEGIKTESWKPFSQISSFKDNDNGRKFFLEESARDFIHKTLKFTASCREHLIFNFQKLIIYTYIQSSNNSNSFQYTRQLLLDSLIYSHYYYYYHQWVLFVNLPSYISCCVTCRGIRWEIL